MNNRYSNAQYLVMALLIFCVFPIVLKLTAGAGILVVGLVGMLFAAVGLPKLFVLVATGIGSLGALAMGVSASVWLLVKAWPTPQVHSAF